MLREAPHVTLYRAGSCSAAATQRPRGQSEMVPHAPPTSFAPAVGTAPRAPTGHSVDAHSEEEEEEEEEEEG
eukprot:6439217-Alexandrium_andersonii.AAC.1